MQLFSPLLVASSAPVIDFDGTAYIQLGIFLVLLLILQPLLFKPWLATRERRSAAIAGQVAAAARLEGEAAAVSETYEAELQKARDSAQELRNDARREIETSRQEIVGAARGSAAQNIVETRERTQREAGEARAALDEEIDILANEIASKLLGRAV